MTIEEISKLCPYQEAHYKRCWIEGFIAVFKEHFEHPVCEELDKYASRAGFDYVDDINRKT